MPRLLRQIFGTRPCRLFVHTVTAKFTQELRLASTGTGPLQRLVGGFYAHEDTRELVDLRDGARHSGGNVASSLPPERREFGHGLY